MWHYFIKGRTIRENLEVFIAMKRYAAFLRGINISGKNKVPMAELKKRFEKLSFKEVKTYLNSGNVLFSSEEENIPEFVEQARTGKSSAPHTARCSVPAPRRP